MKITQHAMKHTQPGRLLLPAVLLLLVALLTGCTGTNSAGTDAAATGMPTAGTPIEPPRELTDFTMTSAAGDPLSLSDLQGRPVLLYFGYTFCPDVCPTTLADFVRVKRDLGEDADKVAFVFISVDPERDTPEKIANYMRAFDTDFIGLQGDEKTLRRIQFDYGLFYQQSQVQGTSADYLVDHSAAAYLIDQEGRLAVIYAFGTPPEVMSADVRGLLQRQ